MFCHSVTECGWQHEAFGWAAISLVWLAVVDAIWNGCRWVDREPDGVNEGGGNGLANRFLCCFEFSWVINCLRLPF